MPNNFEIESQCVAEKFTENARRSGRGLDERERYYVYALLNPMKPGPWRYTVCGKSVEFDYQPFYVGKGRGLRMFEHVDDARQGYARNLHKTNTIKKITSSGFAVLERQISALSTEATALAKEFLLIRAIGRADIKTGVLTNKSDGGEGPNGLVHTEETKQRIRRSLKGRAKPAGFGARVASLHTGLKRSEETKQKIRDRALGRVRSLESRLKQSASSKGKPKAKKPKVSCPHCSKIGAANLMSRYHFDNCKLVNIEQNKG